MNVLVVGRGHGIGEWKPLLRQLAERGHDVQIVADRDGDEGDEIGAAPATPFDPWSYLAFEVDRAAAHLQEGATVDGNAEIPALLASIPRGWRSSPFARRVLRALLRACDRAVPTLAPVDDFLETRSPELVLVPAVAERDSVATDFVRSASRLGIATGIVQPGRDAGGILTPTGARPATRVRRRTAWYAPLARPVLTRVATRLARTERARQEKAARQEWVKRQRDAERLARRAAAAVAKQRAHAEGLLRRQQEDVVAEAERQKERAVAAAAYEHYQVVRAHARRMLVPEDDGRCVTPRERQMREGLAPLWNATPEVIAQLRRHCEPISGIPVSDYEPGSEECATRLRRALGVLWRQVGRELFSPELRILGAFGYEKNDELYNEDALRSFSALVALQDGAVLGAFRHSSERRLVWEIGGGWGGFARQFTALCPNVTYVITGCPGAFLLSAVYLMTAVPGARCRFYEPSSEANLWDHWQDADFIFVPERAVSSLQPPRLDLVLDLMALRDLTPTRVSLHVQRAFDLGGRFFYSMMPWTSAVEVPAVWREIERAYWPHPVPPRRDQPKPIGDGITFEPAPDPPFAHLIGWRRVRV